jgi:hypothetical protein
MTKDVAFETVRAPINDRIDNAHRTKYGGSPYLSPMVSGRTRAATFRSARRRKIA